MPTEIRINALQHEPIDDDAHRMRRLAGACPAITPRRCAGTGWPPSKTTRTLGKHSNVQAHRGS